MSKKVNRKNRGVTPLQLLTVARVLENELNSVHVSEKDLQKWFPNSKLHVCDRRFLSNLLRKNVVGS